MTRKFITYTPSSNYLPLLTNVLLPPTITPPKRLPSNKPPPSSPSYPCFRLPLQISPSPSKLPSLLKHPPSDRSQCQKHWEALKGLSKGSKQSYTEKYCLHLLSLHSKHFHLASKQRKTEEKDFRFGWREIEREQKNEIEGRGGIRKKLLPFFPPSPCSFTHAIFCVVFGSCSSFFAPKLYRNVTQANTS